MMALSGTSCRDAGHSDGGSSIINIFIAIKAIKEQTIMKNTDSNNIDIFETRPVPEAIRLMIMPAIFSMLIILVYNMADTFYLGRTNNPYMVAAVSLILPVFNLTLSLAGLTGIGGGALISRLLGAGQEEEAQRASSFSFYLSLTLAAAFSAGILIFMGPLLRLLGASGNTFLYARQYTFIVLVLGGIPTVLSNVLSNLLRSIGESAKAGFGVTMGGLLNIGLDPLFMFVLLPQGCEVVGVGLATLISNCCACIYFFIRITRLQGRSVLSFNPKAGLPEPRNIRSIFYVGIPSAVGTLLFDIDYVVLDRLMAGFGDIALAGIGIVLKAERLPLNVGIGICQGVMPLVGYNYSSGNRKRMNHIIRYSLILGVVIGIVSVILYELCAHYILRFFIADTQTVELGTNFLRIRCLATPLMFMCFFTVYLFQAFGEGGISLFLGVMRWAVFNIPMLFILSRLTGMYGLTWSQFTADILSVALTAVVYFSYKKKHLPETIPENDPSL